MPAVEELPSTIKRSPKKAQNTWIKAHDNAVKEYGEGRRAHMTAFAALKHSFEKVGDHWEPKEKKGPSDERAAMTRPGKATEMARAGKAAVTRTAKAAMSRTAKTATKTAAKTAEGVNANATKEHLQELAARLDVRGRSKMTKQELVNAIKKANRKLTAKARTR
ncbi:ChaB family protein [Nonomuraea jabiensis]|uniref:ChaB family protein n=1 Tax=Nonomuraea jabiensis TaxID=882448 RepID=UPI003D709C3C